MASDLLECLRRNHLLSVVPPCLAVLLDHIYELRVLSLRPLRLRAVIWLDSRKCFEFLDDFSVSGVFPTAVDEHVPAGDHLVQSPLATDMLRDSVPVSPVEVHTLGELVLVFLCPAVLLRPVD